MKLEYPKEWFERSAAIEGTSEVGAGCPAVAGSALRVPRERPAQWRVGDLAVKYITLRRDDDPMPPCVLVMVTAIEGNICHCEHLDMNSQDRIKADQLDGVAEALEYFERLTDEMTGKSARLGREKLEALASPITPFPEWLRTLEWWDTHPEDRPDGYEVMRLMIPSQNAIGEARADSASPPQDQTL